MASRPTTPAMPARTMEGDAPVSSTYVMTTGSEKRRPRESRDAQQREGERPHAAKQHDVLTRDRHDVEEAAAPEVVDGLLVDAFVVAQHHALQHLGDLAVKPRAKVCS